MLIDYKKTSENDIYHLMAQTVIPRPIAWIMTLNKKGELNIAPFSFFIPLSSSPASLIVSIGNKSNGEPKDTLQNLRDTQKCTICICDESFLNDMNNSALELSKNESEIEKFDIKTKNIIEDFPPIVQNIPSAFFCTLLEEIDLKSSKTRPLVLEVHSQYLDSNVVKKNNDKLSINFKAIARVGRSFAKIGDCLEINK